MIHKSYFLDIFFLYFFWWRKIFTNVEIAQEISEYFEMEKVSLIYSITTIKKIRKFCSNIFVHSCIAYLCLSCYVVYWNFWV